MQPSNSREQNIIAFLRQMTQVKSTASAASCFTSVLNQRFRFDFLAFKIAAKWFYLKQNTGGWTTYEELMLLRNEEPANHIIEKDEERQLVLCSEEDYTDEQLDDLLILVEAFVKFLPDNLMPIVQADDKDLEHENETADLEVKLKEVKSQLIENQQVAKIGNWSINQKTKDFACSLSLARVIGMEEEELPTNMNGFLRLFDDKSQKKILKANMLIAIKGGMYEEELTMLRSDGSRRSFLATAKAIENKRGKVQSISGAIRDITELKNIEESLRRSERRLSAATKGAHIGIWEKSLRSNKLFVNPISREILGTHPTQTQISVTDLLHNTHEEDRKLIRSFLEHGDTLKDNLHFVFRFKRNGNIAYLEASATLYYARSAEKARYIGVLMDITYRKLNEIKLKEINLQLEGILTNSSSAIFIKRSSGQLTLINKTGRKWWNIEQDTELNENQYFEENELHITREMDSRVVIEKAPFTYEVSTSIAGEEKILLLTKFPIIYSEEEIFIGGIATDITQIKTSEKELRKAVAKAKESDRLKSAFLANMSHEIRTPLNSIIGFSDILKRTSIAEADRARFLKIINEQGKHLLTILNDIIDLSAIESNQLKLNYSDVNLTELLEIQQQAFQSKTSVIDKKGVEIILSTPTKGAFFTKTDPLRINQIFTNLLGNAIKFTNTGHIKFGYRLNQGNISFFVEDTGSGIPESHLKVIFKRFRQVDQSDTRKHGGTGLGLAITKALLELMGGDISVTSEVGVGTVFSFSLPLEESLLEVQQEPEKLEIPDLSDKRILIVEDDHNSAFLMQTLLDSTGASIEVLHFGKEAISYCASHTTVDLVLMDLQLPDISGYESTQLIKQINPSIKIVAQTAQAMASNKERAIQAGCDDFVTKPIHVDAVYDVLRRVFSR